MRNPGGNKTKGEPLQLPSHRRELEMLKKYYYVRKARNPTPKTKVSAMKKRKKVCWCLCWTRLFAAQETLRNLEADDQPNRTLTDRLYVKEATRAP